MVVCECDSLNGPYESSWAHVSKRKREMLTFVWQWSILKMSAEAPPSPWDKYDDCKMIIGVSNRVRGSSDVYMPVISSIVMV